MLITTPQTIQTICFLAVEFFTYSIFFACRRVNVIITVFALHPFDKLRRRRPQIAHNVRRITSVIAVASHFKILIWFNSLVMTTSSNSIANECLAFYLFKCHLGFFAHFLITCCLLNWCHYGAILRASFNKKCYFIMYSTAIMNCLYPYVTAANPPSSRTRRKKAF